MTTEKSATDDVINDDTRQKFGSEAIEQLASGLNLAAHTIEEFSQNVSMLYCIILQLYFEYYIFNLILQTIDEESLKQLNDEQLFRLLEEAYHSKKLDEKNKSAIFKVSRENLQIPLLLITHA